MHPFKQATDMDPNTRFLNSGMSSDPQDPNAQHYQNFHLPQYSLNYPPPNPHQKTTMEVFTKATWGSYLQGMPDCLVVTRPMVQLLQ